MNSSSYITSAKKISIIQVFKLLSNEARLKTIKILLKAKKDLCVNEIADHIGMSQSATSHQLALLESRGIVRGVKNGQIVCYFLTDSETVKIIKKIIKTLA